MTIDIFLTKLGQLAIARLHPRHTNVRMLGESFLDEHSRLQPHIINGPFLEHWLFMYATMLLGLFIG